MSHAVGSSSSVHALNTFLSILTIHVIKVMCVRLSELLHLGSTLATILGVHSVSRLCKHAYLPGSTVLTRRRSLLLNLVPLCCPHCPTISKVLSALLQLLVAGVCAGKVFLDDIRTLTSVMLCDRPRRQQTGLRRQQRGCVPSRHSRHPDPSRYV